MAAKKHSAIPYTTEDAVDDEKAFWKHIGDLLKEKIDEVLVKRGFQEALDGMRRVVRTHDLLIQRTADIGSQHARLIGQYDQLISVMTVRGARQDQLEQRLERFLDNVSPTTVSKIPPITPPSPDPDPTPPRGDPEG